MDFMSDALLDGRKLHVLNVIDDCSREAIAIDEGFSYPASEVVETLENFQEEIGTPQYISCDNGPEFISRTFMNRCKKNHIEIKHTSQENQCKTVT